MRATVGAVLAVLAIVGGLIVPAELLAQETSPAETVDLAPITQWLDGNEEVAGNHRLCPADTFGTDMPYWRYLMPSATRTEGACEADVALCRDDCMVRRNEEACFALGRVLQRREETEVDRRYPQMMFSQACATGSAGGCTNRAASIRNAMPVDDPFSTMESGARDACLTRSFAVACKAGDAWGCAMEGQSHQFGEGTAIDLAEARRAYEASCAIDEDFAACDYIKPRLDGLR